MPSPLGFRVQGLGFKAFTGAVEVDEEALVRFWFSRIPDLLQWMPMP
jgi:hypothetical protein